MIPHDSHLDAIETIERMAGALIDCPDLLDSFGPRVTQLWLAGFTDAEINDYADEAARRALIFRRQIQHARAA